MNGPGAERLAPAHQRQVSLSWRKSLPEKRGQKLRLRNEEPLGAHQALAKVAQKVAFAEQAFGAWLIEYDLGVHGVGDFKAHFQRKVCLDQPGDDRAVWSLRREHEMDAGGAALAGDAGDQRLELFLVLAPGEDQVSELVEAVRGREDQSARL